MVGKLTDVLMGLVCIGLILLVSILLVLAIAAGIKFVDTEVLSSSSFQSSLHARMEANQVKAVEARTRGTNE